MSDPKQNLRDLRDLIAGLPEGRFDISRWAYNPKTQNDIMPRRLQHTCNTAGCLAGWATAIAAKRGDATGGSALSIAMNWLGLSLDQAHSLFLPPGNDYPERFPKSRALATLDHLIETGEVKWPSKREAA